MGGIETHVQEIAERLAKRHEVLVFTLVSGNGQTCNEIINGVNVRRFKPIRLSYSLEFPRGSMLREIERFQPDVLHAHGIHTIIPFFASRVNSNSKLVITPHYLGKSTTLFRKFLFFAYKPLLNVALSKSDRIICSTSTEKNMLNRSFNVDNMKIRMIPNGVGTDLAKIVPKRDGMRILSVARLDLYHKKTDKLIRAFKLIESKINAKLVLVGDGPDRKEIMKLINSLGLSEKIEVKSNLTRDQLVQEYANATVFVTASEIENFGIAVAEALAAKLKVVVPNSTALSLFVDAGHALGMEMPITIEKIAEAMMTCLQDNNKFLEYSPYTWDMAAEELHKLYEELSAKDC
ncbi:MAG: hypothetical protein AUH84_03300 [Thaumarchaeota archaeon 13_1_40CM_4_38_7]|nr:MAG: hypothetical protein AUH84_03300 [Thaumarchaeota archaeon 13_1_40CM_4_38_7]